MCAFSHGATESGIMVIKSLLYKGIFNEYIRCLDGSETNLSGPTPPLKAAQRAAETKGTMPHTK